MVRQKLHAGSCYQEEPFLNALTMQPWLPPVGTKLTIPQMSSKFNLEALPCLCGATAQNTDAELTCSDRCEGAQELARVECQSKTAHRTGIEQRCPPTGYQQPWAHANWGSWEQSVPTGWQNGGEASACLCWKWSEHGALPNRLVCCWANCPKQLSTQKHQSSVQGIIFQIFKHKQVRLLLGALTNSPAEQTPRWPHRCGTWQWWPHGVLASHPPRLQIPRRAPRVTWVWRAQKQSSTALKWRHTSTCWSGGVPLAKDWGMHGACLTLAPHCPPLKV